MIQSVAFHKILQSDLCTTYKDPGKIGFICPAEAQSIPDVNH